MTTEPLEWRSAHAQPQRAIWGVVGGMGPVASAAFLQTIYETCTGRSEQAMPIVLLQSDPTFPDRTAALLAGDSDALVRRLTTSIDALVDAGADEIVICCMTMHAVIARLPERCRERVVSLVDVLLAQVLDQQRRTLLLCTDGSRQAGVYEASALWARARRYVLLPDAVDQARVHALIYSLKRRPPRRDHFRLVDALVADYGAACAAAGCTEIHLLFRAARRRRAHWRLRIDPLALVAAHIASPTRPVTVQAVS